MRSLLLDRNWDTTISYKENAMLTTLLLNRNGNIIFGSSGGTIK